MGLVEEMKSKKKEILSHGVTEEEFALAMETLGEMLHVDPMEQEIPAINEDGGYT